jgi:hypothetical protein
MVKTKPKSPDPLIETPAPDVPQMDYPSHVRTYNRFLNAVKWFAIHIAFLAAALYFFIIAGNSIAGAVFLIIAVGLLIFGLGRNPGVRQDAGEVLGGPEASQ